MRVMACQALRHAAPVVEHQECRVTLSVRGRPKCMLAKAFEPTSDLACPPMGCAAWQ